MEDLIDLPSINLTEGADKDRVTIKILPWDGDLTDMGELTEVWVQIEGIPPKRCTWKVITQISKSFGLLLDVDWNEIFKSMYKTVRVKLAVRNPAKIPSERMVVIRKKFYLLKLTMEWDGVDMDKVMALDDRDYDEDEDYEEDNLMEDELQDLTKNKDSKQQNQEKQTSHKPPLGASHSTPPKAGSMNSFHVLASASLLDSDDEHIPVEIEDNPCMQPLEENLTDTHKLTVASDATLQSTEAPTETETIQTILGEELNTEMEMDNTIETVDKVEFPTPAEANKKKNKKKRWGLVVPTRQSAR